MQKHKKSKSVATVLCVSALLWLIHLLPFALPQARLWGFNHLNFGPPLLTVIYFAGGIIALIVLLMNSREKTISVYDNLAESLLNKNFHRKWIVFAFLAGIIFWLARMPVNLLGDGYNLIYSLNGDKPVIFKWSEIGAIKVVFYVSRLLPFSGIELGKNAYALVSVISGGITVGFLGGIAYVIGTDHRSRLFALCLLLFSGWLLLFFGYVEHYPLLWVFASGYLFFGLRYLKGKGNIIPATAMLLAASAMHLQFLFFLPAHLALIISRGPAGRIYRRRRKIFYIHGTIITMLGLLLFIRQYMRSESFQLFFVPLFGRPNAPDYSLLSAPHLIDMANQLILVIPLAPVLAVMAWKKIRQRALDTVDKFLLVFSLGGLALLFMIEPDLGMGRDWDLFALSGLGPALFMIKQTVSLTNGFQRLYPGLILLALVLCIPFFGVNLSYRPAVEYYTWLLDLDQERSRSGLVLLKQFYEDEGNPAAAEKINRKMLDCFPILMVGKRIEILTEKGQYQAALYLADSVYREDPYSVEAHNLLGWVYLSMGRYRKAAEHLEKSISVQPYDHRIRANLAHAYYRLGDYRPMMENYTEAFHLNPAYLPALDGLALGYYSLRDFDSALVYARLGLEIDSLYVTGYEIIGTVSYLKNDYRNARIFLNRFLQLSTDPARRSRAEQILAKMGR